MNPCHYFNSCYSKISLLFDPKWCYAPCVVSSDKLDPKFKSVNYGKDIVEKCSTNDDENENDNLRKLLKLGVGDRARLKKYDV